MSNVLTEPLIHYKLRAKETHMAKTKCGVPDIPNFNIEKDILSRFQADTNPPPCKCCATKMRTVDCSSDSMDALGMYYLVCDTCTADKCKAAKRRKARQKRLRARARAQQSR